MTYQQILSHFGGDPEWGRVRRAAAKLQLAESTLASWKKRGVPHGWQSTIQIRTAGALMADSKPAARG